MPSALRRQGATQRTGLSYDYDDENENVFCQTRLYASDDRTSRRHVTPYYSGLLLRLVERPPQRDRRLPSCPLNVVERTNEQIFFFTLDYRIYYVFETLKTRERKRRGRGGGRRRKKKGVGGWKTKKSACWNTTTSVSCQTVLDACVYVLFVFVCYFPNRSRNWTVRTYFLLTWPHPRKKKVLQGHSISIMKKGGHMRPFSDFFFFFQFLVYETVCACVHPLGFVTKRRCW